MERVCHWCGKHMGDIDGIGQAEVLSGICDECVRKLRLEERVPELLWGMAALRKQNNGRVQCQIIGVFSIN